MIADLNRVENILLWRCVADDLTVMLKIIDCRILIKRAAPNHDKYVIKYDMSYLPAINLPVLLQSMY